MSATLVDFLPQDYRLRRSRRGEHLCTAEVAALCLDKAGDAQAGALLQAWLDVYSERYLLAKNQRPVDPDSAAHRQLAAAQA